VKVALVSGASGFLGRYVVRALVSGGYRVHGISRHPPDDPTCVWHDADLFDAASVRSLLDRVRPTHLLHLAWITEHDRYWTSPENLHWVEATLRLGRQFRDSGGRRLVGVGTCAEYTWDDAVLGGKPIDERNTPRTPAHLYGVAKNATFELLTAYCAAVGIGFAWGRVFFPYGPHDRRPTLVPSIIQTVSEGRPALCTHGRQQRDFIHVQDAGAALAALLDSEVRGPVNVGTGTATPIAEIARRLAALLGRPDLIRVGVIDTRPNDPAFLVANVSRLRDEVGFVPTITLADGLQNTVASSGLEASKSGHP